MMTLAPDGTTGKALKPLKDQVSGASLDKQTTGNIPDRVQASVTSPAHTPEDIEPGKVKLFTSSTADDPSFYHNPSTPHDPPHSEDLPMADDPSVLQNSSPNHPLTPNNPPAAADDDFLLSRALSDLLLNEHLLYATTEVEVYVHSSRRSRKPAPKKPKQEVKLKPDADRPETLEKYSKPKEGSIVNQQASFLKLEVTTGNGKGGLSSNNNTDDQEIYDLIMEPAMAALRVFMSVYREGDDGAAVRTSTLPLKVGSSLLYVILGIYVFSGGRFRRYQV